MELSKVQQVAACWLTTVFVTVSLVGCDVVTSGGPLDRAAALQQSQSELPLPPSAHEIYYHHVDRGTQDHDLFVLFSGDTDTKEIEEFILAQFENEKNFRQKMGRSFSDPIIDRNPQAMAKTLWGSSRGLPDWWHPETIKKGFYIGSKPGAFPVRHFWIDEVEGRVFFYGHY